MKTFIIQTTSNDKWEVAEGVCVIVANTEAEAREIYNISPKYGEIKKIIQVDTKKKGFVFEQGPVVE